MCQIFQGKLKNSNSEDFFCKFVDRATYLTNNLWQSSENFCTRNFDMNIFSKNLGNFQKSENLVKIPRNFLESFVDRTNGYYIQCEFFVFLRSHIFLNNYLGWENPKTQKTKNPNFFSSCKNDMKTWKREKISVVCNRPKPWSFISVFFSTNIEWNISLS